MLAAGIAGGNPANILPVYSSAGNVLFAVVALQRGCYAQQAWYARMRLTLGTAGAYGAPPA